VVGVVTANIYLHSIDISSFSPLSVQYILTGALVFLAVLIAAVPGGLVAASFVSPPGSRGIGRSVSLALLSSSVAFTMFLLVQGLLGTFYQPEPPTPTGAAVLIRVRHWPVASSLSLVLFGAAFGGLFYWAWTRDSGPSAKRRARVAGYFVGVMVLLGIFTREFAITVYPLVPPEFGGARPRYAEFLFTNPDLPASLQLLHCAHNPAMTPPMQVLFQTGDGFVVYHRVPAEPIQIQSSAVEAIHTLTEDHVASLASEGKLCEEEEFP